MAIDYQKITLCQRGDLIANSCAGAEIHTLRTENAALRAEVEVGRKAKLCNHSGQACPFDNEKSAVMEAMDRCEQEQKKDWVAEKLQDEAFRKGVEKLRVKACEDQDRLVEVCAACYKACCFQGEFMCDDNVLAGTRMMTVRELEDLGFETSEWWGPTTTPGREEGGEG